MPFLLLFILAFNRVAWADEVNVQSNFSCVSSNASGSLDTETLCTALDSYLETNVPRTHEPGVAVAVVTTQGAAYMRTFGTCTSVNDSFYIGSLSKSMCAVAIMQLVEQGKVDLDAPAFEYVPEYPVSPQVTVRMLLNQTSGFGYYESLSQATEIGRAHV